MKRQTIADSVLISLVAAAFSLGSLGLLLTRDVPLPDELSYLGIGLCGAPLIAVFNIVFIVRDHRNGRPHAARFAAILSAGSAFVGMLPGLLAD